VDQRTALAIGSAQEVGFFTQNGGFFEKAAREYGNVPSGNLT
jgi:hypothetical protein